MLFDYHSPDLFSLFWFLSGNPSFTCPHPGFGGYKNTGESIYRQTLMKFYGENTCSQYDTTQNKSTEYDTSEISQSGYSLKEKVMVGSIHDRMPAMSYS